VITGIGYWSLKMSCLAGSCAKMLATDIRFGLLSLWSMKEHVSFPIGRQPLRKDSHGGHPQLGTPQNHFRLLKGRRRSERGCHVRQGKGYIRLY